MVRWIAALSVVGVALAAGVAAQLPPPAPPPPEMAVSGPVPTGTGAISGLVTDGSTGVPIAGALVSLLGGGATGGPTVPGRPRQMTDSRGRFLFTNLPASPAYSLSVSAAGYLDGGYRRLPGTTAGGRLVLTDGQWISDGHVSLWRPAAISGTVRDERGEPLVGIPVRVLIGAMIAGRARWASGPVTHTDDRGMYRIAGLQRGRYLVHVPSVQITLPSGEPALYTTPPRGNSVGAPAPTGGRTPLHTMRAADGTGLLTGHYPSPPPDARGSAYPPAFYPSARSLDAAEAISVDFAEDRSGVDVQMIPAATVSVSGVVAGPADAVNGIGVRLLAAGNESLGIGGESGLTKTDATGRFTFHRVPEGRYTLIVGRSTSEYRASTSSGSDSRLIPFGANPFVSRTSSMAVAGGIGISLATGGMSGVDVNGRLEISVGAQPLTGVVIPVTPTVTVSGRFEWDGSETPPAGLQFVPSVRIEPADGDLTLGSYFAGLLRPPDAGATRLTFTIENVKPGRYTFGELLGGSGEHRLIGVSWQGRNLLDTPLEVTGDGPVTDVILHLSTQRNSLRGTVRDASGRPAEGAIVIAFPAASAAWKEPGVSALRFQVATIAGEGTYQFLRLLPGDYLIAAIAEQDRGRMLDPVFLAAIAPQASRIRLDASTAATQDLRVIGGAR